MSLFHRSHIRFNQPDPLDDGTVENIAHEKDESAINLMDDDTQGIVAFWDDIHRSTKKDSQK